MIFNRFILLDFSFAGDDDVALNLKKEQVCFNITWNLEFKKKNCITISKNNSCTDYNVTLKEDPCNKPFNKSFKLPPGKHHSY